MPKEIFDTMNGLRGLAALAIIMFHAPEWFGAMTPTKGYLAVDLFFVLSGFVIAHSYESRLAASMTISRFISIRLIRLYPLYFFGTMITFFALLTSLYLQGHILDVNADKWRAIPFAFLMLPAPNFTNPFASIYPLNPVAWSLFFELFVNILYAYTFWWWSIRNISIVMAIMACFMLARSDFYGDGGINWISIHLGILRVLYSFPAGVLIYRLRVNAKHLLPTINSVVVVAGFPALLMLPDAWIVQFSVLIGFPLLVVFAAQSNPGRVARPIFAALGGASYAIYAVHFPLMNLVNLALRKYGAGMNLELVGYAFIIAIAPICLLIDRFFDTPVRRALTRVFLTPSRGDSVAK